jgi:hypothetical protein
VCILQDGKQDLMKIAMLTREKFQRYLNNNYDKKKTADLLKQYNILMNFINRAK